MMKSDSQLEILRAWKKLRTTHINLFDHIRIFFNRLRTDSIINEGVFNSLMGALYGIFHDKETTSNQLNKQLRNLSEHEKLILWWYDKLNDHGDTFRTFMKKSKKMHLLLNFYAENYDEHFMLIHKDLC